MNKEIKVLVLSGSIRKESYTRSLAEHTVGILGKKNVSVIHWNLLEKPLPIMVPELRDDVDNHPDATVKEFAKQARECDAYVLASPIYHNSFSGALKNAIDHLRSAHFTYKPMGLMSFGGDGSLQAVDQLRIIGRSVHAIVTTEIVCASEDDFSGMELTSEELKNRIEKFCDELILFAETFGPIRETKKKHVKNK